MVTFFVDKIGPIILGHIYFFMLKYDLILSIRISPIKILYIHQIYHMLHNSNNINNVLFYHPSLDSHKLKGSKIILFKNNVSPTFLCILSQDEWQ